jgi:hypothetical protein
VLRTALAQAPEVGPRRIVRLMDPHSSLFGRSTLYNEIAASRHLLLDLGQ